MPDINMQVFEEAKRNQLVTEVDIQTQVALDNYQVQLSDITNPTQSQDNVVIDRFGEFLPHWNKSIDFDTWVKMSMEVAGKRILMLRGNSSISNVSSIDDTFIFGDDFPSNSVDSLKWTETDEGSNINVASGLLSLTGNTGWDTNGVLGKTALDRTSQGYIIELKQKHSAYDASIWGYRPNLGSAGEDANFYTYATALAWYDTGWLSYTASLPSAGTFYETKIVLKDATNIEQIYSGETKSFTDDGNNGYIGISVYQTATTYVDWVFVRKYTATEPTWLADGAEQNIVVALKSLGRAG